MKFILGKKIEMTQMFDKDKKVTPVTLIEAGPCFVLQTKNKEKDGYDAIQIGFDQLKKAKKSASKKPYRHLKEFTGEGLKEGDKIDVSIFEEGEKVIVSGISKGKGYAGAVKKWGFAGRGASHGVKHEERTIGSIGSAFPQRVIKGKKMPGRMGTERITVKGLKITKIDLENNILALKGAVPGRRGTLLEIKTRI
jgi:large subunit ribosomal protein L3